MFQIKVLTVAEIPVFLLCQIWAVCHVFIQNMLLFSSEKWVLARKNLLLLELGKVTKQSPVIFLITKYLF